MALSEGLRLFFAVPVADDLRPVLTQVQARLKTTGAKVGWVKSGNLHFTLKFLGDTPEEQVSQLAEVARQVATAIPVHQIKMCGAGGFPNARRPRVVWVGCTDGREQFAQLGQQLDEALVQAGLAEPEKRSFTPHLTLGRVRSRHGLEDLAAAMRELSEHEVGEMQVDHFVLIRSQLHPQGAVYTPVARFELSG